MLFQKTLEKMRKNEGGFTLIELLVVMIIIGLLAAIAIPIFLSQRDKAKVNALESDLRNAAVYMEAAFTADDATYPDTVAALEAEGFSPSGNVTLEEPIVEADGYCLEATNSALPTGSDVYSLDTRAGATDAGHPVEGPCAA